MNYLTRGLFPIMLACAAIVLIQVLSHDPSYRHLCALPVTFAAVAGFLVVSRRGSDSLRWLEGILIALWFVRLVVIPCLILLAGESYAAIGPYPSASEFRRGSNYLAYEVAVLGLALTVARRYSVPTSTRASFRPGSYVPQALLILVGGFGLILPQVRERFSFFLTPITATAREIVSGYDASSASLASLTNLGRLAVPALVITLALRSYGRRPSLVPVLIATFGCVAANVFYVATSRASFFIPLVAALIVLTLAFPRERKLILASGGVALLLTTLVVTLNKSFAGESGTNVADLADYLSIYLMGPKEYAMGIRAVDMYGPEVTGRTLFGDVFGNVPFISGLVDPLDRTSQYYNWTYLGASLGIGGGFIAPGAVQSAFYVGWVFGPLVPALGLVPAVLGLRYLHGREQDPSLSYVAAYAVVFSLLFHTNSFSTVVSGLAYPILPLLLLALSDRAFGSSRRVGNR